MKLCMGCMEHYSDRDVQCPHCGYIEGTRSENAMHMTPGTILMERYIVGKVIGFGGFGVTYIGWDALLQTKIAIKEYLPSEFSTRVVGQTQVTVYNGDKHEQFSDGMKKFIEEAKRLAKFHSASGIVKIFDSFECNNTAYIIMELLEGETLAEMLTREKTLSTDQAIRMMRPIMESLLVVHKSGIIHRDIAPDNIFVTKNGEVKLIDFGAARYATTTHSRSLTVIIKPGYSPEEQYRSKGDQGPHTDVYAVAATMYKMITGITPPDALERRAFYENKKKDILEPISKHNKSISANQETAILNALNVLVEDRTPTMERFIEELDSADTVKRVEGTIKKVDVLKWPLWAKIGVPVLSVALISFIVLFATGVIGFNANLKKDIEIPEGQTRVPSILSSDYTSAQDMIKSANLQFAVAGKSFSELVPANYVLEQDINPGVIVPENTVVKITVSSGSVLRIVPQTIGFSSAEAADLLQSQGFVVKLEETYDPAVAEGCIVDQSLSPGEQVDDGTEIVLTVSLGRDPSVSYEDKDITVPDLSNMTYEEALEAAKDFGFAVKVTERRFSKDLGSGKIMAQSIGAGETASSSSVIELTVSKGYEKIAVPDVVYKSEEEATADLEVLCFNVETEYQYDDSTEAGLVISQSIAPDSSADPESTVKLVISKGSAPFSAPSVVGKNEKDASSTLQSSGLVVSVSYKKDNSKTEGEVLSQDPAAGGEVQKGSTVTIYVCTHDATVSVPSVVGMDKDKAMTTLEDKGFLVKFNDVTGSGRPKGEVLSQTPAAGTDKEEGTVIVVNVSSGEAVSVTETTTTTRQTTVTTTTTTRKMTTTTAKPKIRVSFDANGGSVSRSSMEVTSGESYGTLPAPTRTGYAFGGWYTSKTGGSQVTASSKAGASSVTLYARWSAQTGTVSFDANGGTASQYSMNVSYESKYGSLPTASLTGYTFKGWYTAKSGGSQITESSTVTVTGDHTLYAQWSKNSYTLRFDANSGTVSTASKTVAYGDTYGDLPNSRRDYYTFSGWYTDPSGGSRVYSDNVMSANDVTVYAHWSLNSTSDWVPASSAPSDAQILERKWTYTKTETTESNDSSKSGWTQTGSYWSQTGNGTWYWGSYPSGFNTGNSLYSKYNKSALSGYENTTTKRTVSGNSFQTYIYWHWSYPLSGNHSEGNRFISNTYNEWISGCGHTTIFEAFESTTNPTFNTSANAYKITGHSTYSYWWLKERVTIYKQTYTDYKKVFQYKKVTNLESSTQVTAGNGISNVQEYVKYRAK